MNMRPSAMALFPLLLILTASPPVAWSDDGGVASGLTVPTDFVPSNQVVRFHAMPDTLACPDCFVAGITLRNAFPAPPTASGTINVPAAVVANAGFAELYWVILDNTVPPPTETFNGVPLDRIACGPVTSDPCWEDITNAFAFRADVLALLAVGDNDLDGFPDSGDLNTAPNTEGATLVVVYESPNEGKEIIVTCGNDLLGPGGAELFDLPLPVVSPPGTDADLYFIGGDGQVDAADEVYWNGGALDAGDAWRGLDPGPGVGYWDSMRFPVVTGPPNTASTDFPFPPPPDLDCVNWVATVLCTEPTGLGGCVVPTEPSTWGQIKSMYKE